MMTLNPTDARLTLPVEVAAFIEDDRRVFALSGPMGSGRARLIRQGLGRVPESDVTWERTSFPGRFLDVLEQTRTPVLVLSDYNLFDPRSAHADWYEQAVSALITGGEIEPYERDGEEARSTVSERRYPRKIILVSEPQEDSESVRHYNTVDGLIYADSAFDLHNFAHRIADELAADDEVEAEALFGALSYLRSLCWDAPELTTWPDPGARPTLYDLMRACGDELSPRERQFYVGSDIQQYLLARAAREENRRVDIDAWRTWDYSGALEVDGLRALVMLPSVVAWFAENGYQSYVLACERDGFTRALLRSAAEKASVRVEIVELDSGAATTGAAVTTAAAGRDEHKRVLWIEPDQVRDASQAAALDELPRLVARDSLSDRVGRLVWFPEHYAKRHHCSVRELELLYPRLYRLLEADPVAAVDRSRTDLPSPDELIQSVGWVSV